MKKVKDYSIEEELELYKAMVEAQPQSMFLMDKDKNLIGIFNAAPETLAGFTEDQIVGNSILKYANDPQSPFHQACSMLNSTFDPVFETGKPLKFQYMILDTYLEATIVKISGDRILSQVRDISDIVLKLKALEQKKRNELSIALLAGGLSSWSYSVEEDVLTSTHDNNVIGDRIPFEELLRLVIAEDIPCVVEMFDKIKNRNSKYEQITIRVRNKEGDIQWTDIHAVPHEYSPDGKVTLIIGSQKDITKEYEYNRELRRLNKQNELILNNTNSGFAFLTASVKVEWENVSMVFSDPEISDMFKERDWVRGLWRLKSYGIASEIMKTIETKKQTVFKERTTRGMIVEAIIQPVFSDESQFEGVVVRIDDVSEKERFVYELAAAKEKAERSDKLKTAFLANVSHEIRTPLNSIVGFSQLLPEVCSPEEQRSYIDIINSNAQVLINLINDILDLSKIEAGYFTRNDSVFNICSLFREMEATFRGKARDGVEFICSLPVPDFYVKLDRVRVSQIISNFVTNAIKFTHQGYIKIGFEADEDCIKLFVQDTGNGMSREQIERVFERFEKFNSFEQGTGLGTSIAKAIVEAYDGDIGVESELKKGSTFWVALPVNMESEDYLEQSHPVLEQQVWNSESTQQRERKPNFRILVAEDNDSNYKLIEILLSGYGIQRAHNGVEALEAAKSESFDIILMDIKMPLMDGVEATSRIRQFNARVPVIALTANVFEDDKQRAYAAGVTDFLPKPISRGQLYEMIGHYAK